MEISIKKNMHYYCSKPCWQLDKTEPAIFNKLIANDATILDVLNIHRFDERCPYLEDLLPMESDSLFRPKGSNRAFYLKLNSGAVIAIKGAEVVSNAIENAMEKNSKEQIGSRPWTKFENFIYREQKSPLALHFNEAEEDQSKALKFQKLMISKFSDFESAPIPLFTYKFSDEIRNNYFSIISKYLSKRALEIISPPLEKYGLGIAIYYYPHTPKRIAFEAINSNISIKKRIQYFKNLQENSFDPFSSIEKLLLIVAKMLLCEIMPLSRESHGIGQCIAKQNVTLFGGITDMGSIIDFSEISSESEFFQLYFSCISVLTSTIREFLTLGQTSYLFEFDDPTPNAIIISNYCVNRIRSYCYQISKEYNFRLSKKIEDLIKLSCESSRDGFYKLLSELY